MRTEEIIIKLKLDKSAEIKHFEDLKVININKNYKEPLVTNNQDWLDVEFKFWAKYFDNLDNQFISLEKIIDDPEVIKEVKIEEVKHGHSLIVSLAGKLKKIIDKLQ